MSSEMSPSYQVLFLMCCALQLDFGLTAPKTIPSYIEICKRSDPHVEDCIINSIEKIKPMLRQGIPEMGVPALEPLNLPQVIVTQLPGFKASASNILVHGASDFKITYLKGNISDDYAVFDTEIFIPKVTFNGDYEVGGKILMLPVNGKGPMSANATGIEGTARLEGVVKKGADGHTHGHFNSLEIKLKKIKNYRVILDGLFGGDKNLGQAINGALNENRKQMFKLLGPVFEKVTADILLETANKIIETYDYNEIFPKE